MPETKKYFYLKLKDNFYNTDDMKLLESMKNGYEYSSLYLKLCLMSLKEDGKLIYKGRIPYKPEMISTITGHNIDIVKAAIDIFVNLEMITILDSGVIFISDIQSLIGNSSSEAERKKKYRDRIKNDSILKIENMGHLSGQTGGHRPPELKIELDPEIKDKSKTKTKTFSPELCKFTADFVKFVSEKRSNKAPKNTKALINNSLDTLDKLIRLDGFSLDYIKDVSRWAVDDEFFSTNFFSLAPLRSKSKNGATKFANMASKYDASKKTGSPNELQSTEWRDQWTNK